MAKRRPGHSSLDISLRPARKEPKTSFMGILRNTSQTYVVTPTIATTYCQVERDSASRKPDVERVEKFKSQGF